MATKHSQLGYYSNYLSADVWGKGKAGSKPTEAMVTEAHRWGSNGKQSFALAMAMRPEGVTDAQIKLVLAKPQNNHRRTLIKNGMFAEVPMPQVANPTGGKALNVYRIELTAKGKAAGKPVAKPEPVKADKPAKVKAPKAVKTPKAPKPGKPAADGSVLIKAKPVQPEPAKPLTLHPEVTAA